MRTTTRIAVLVLGTLLCGVHGGFAASVGPAAATKAFFARHFSKRELMTLSRPAIERERSGLTPRLYGLLVHELDRTDAARAAYAGPDPFAPFVVGDVFTGTEIPPDGFRVGRARVTGTTARVDVASTWRTPPSSRDAARSVAIVLKRVGGRWLVDDVEYPDRGTLVDLLSRPEYDSYGT